MPGLCRVAPRFALTLASLWLVACQAAPPTPPTPAPAMPTTNPAGPASTPAPRATAAPAATATPLPTPHVPTPPPLEPVAAGTASLDPRFGIAEGFRNPAVMSDIGAGWERVVLSWDDIQPDGPDDFSWLGRTLPPRALAGELQRGVRVAGLLQFTATWAATDLRDPGRSVPRNLDLPDDDPRNYWARFVFETVRYYTGRIDEWIVWNEPEFRPDDAAGTGSYTWLGSDEDFARLMQVAYRAAKRANPRAIISFPGTSYWVDRNAGRPQFYERFLRLLANDPRARDNAFYHDAVSLNLYRAPDDLVRLHQAFKDIQRRHGVDAPIWLLELNAMPTDDTTIPCADVHAGNPIQTTQAQQAAYAVQALALAAAVGYQRVSFYQMVDDNPCRQSAVWGITRDDGTARPVAQSLQTAIRTLSGFTGVQFVPTVRPQARWSAWPADPGSLLPNWQIYQVALDLPGERRVTVLWNGDDSPARIRVPRRGSAARLIDGQGKALASNNVGQDWSIDLPAATAHYSGDPAGYFFIGGEPRLLVEDGVPADAPVAPVRVS
jgi:hypothetical protein